MDLHWRIVKLRASCRSYILKTKFKLNDKELLQATVRSSGKSAESTAEILPVTPAELFLHSVAHCVLGALMLSVVHSAQCDSKNITPLQSFL